MAEAESGVGGHVAWAVWTDGVTSILLPRTAVIPREQPCPNLRLVVEQRAQVNGRKMPEVENLQCTPAQPAGKDCGGKPPSLGPQQTGRQTGEHQSATSGGPTPVWIHTL